MKHAVTLLSTLLLSLARSEAAVREPFDGMAQETVRALKADPKFGGLETEIFVARPFVILMTREADADKKALEERRQRLGALAQGVWRNWLALREKWQLESNRKAKAIAELAPPNQETP